MNGLVVVDKPQGPTSFDVVARLRRVFRTREIGHCGTLDPLATGVLVVAIGTWTRLVRVLTADDKRYVATIAFGSSTTTDDREGEVVESSPNAVDVDELRSVLATFVGPLKQRPPAFSAVHVGGERAYKKARAGEVVELEERDVVVHAVDLLSFDAETRSAVVDVKCGKGTYIRALARDIGRSISVPAHLHALRRSESGAYTLKDAVKLDALDERALRSNVDDVRGVTKLDVSADEARALRQGKRILLGGRLRFDHTALAAHANDLIALVRLEGQQVVVERAFPA